MNVCKQTFRISQVRISQKIKGALIQNFSILFLCEDQDIGRFSYLHQCTFKYLYLRRFDSF